MDELNPGDPNYPALLGAIPSPPTLSVRGAVTVDDALALAIVGARDATPYGVEVAERLAGELGARGVTIVSGLARGIDAAAHSGAKYSPFQAELLPRRAPERTGSSRTVLN